MAPTTPFTAFRIENDDAGYRSGLAQLRIDDLNPGQVLIRAHWSSVNYKDALAGTGKGKILRRFPLVGGIDVAGTVVASSDPDWREGDAVLATGCGLSETRDGGYSQYVRLESRAVIAQPAGLTPREAMVLGTAGFTAALALLRMQDNRQTRNSARWQSPVPAAASVRWRCRSSAVPATACTRSAASRTRPISCAASAPPRYCHATRWPIPARCSRRASAVASTMPEATCWPACWRRPCPTAAWSAPVWPPARRWT